MILAPSPTRVARLRGETRLHVPVGDLGLMRAGIAAGALADPAGPFHCAIERTPAIAGHLQLFFRGGLAVFRGGFVCDR